MFPFQFCFTFSSLRSRLSNFCQRVVPLTTLMSLCWPSKFCSSLKHTLNVFVLTFSTQTVAASCFTFRLVCSAVTNTCGVVLKFCKEIILIRFNISNAQMNICNRIKRAIQWPVIKLLEQLVFSDACLFFIFFLFYLSFLGLFCRLFFFFSTSTNTIPKFLMDR